VGIEQMKKLDGRIKRKKQILLRYQQALDGVKTVRFFEQDLKSTTPWFIDVLCEGRDQLQVYLKEKGIGTRVMYPPINRQKAYQRPGSYPVSELVGEKGLWLPSSSRLSDEQIDSVCDAIRQFYN
jgi:perosamine synthetase